jgi:hypothetical protein
MRNLVNIAHNPDNTWRTVSGRWDRLFGESNR